MDWRCSCLVRLCGIYNVQSAWLGLIYSPRRNILNFKVIKSFSFGPLVIFGTYETVEYEDDCLTYETVDYEDDCLTYETVDYEDDC